MPRLAEERGKTRIGVEAGPAEPVDRTVHADEGGRLTIPDQGVIFDS
jgi:hypothetical protein